MWHLPPHPAYRFTTQPVGLGLICMCTELFSRKIIMVTKTKPIFFVDALKICPFSDSQFSLIPKCCKFRWSQLPFSDPNWPCVVGIHSQSLPHAGDVLLQCWVCQCLQGHTVGFMEVPSIFCQAVTQIILMEFQNSCKAPESGGYLCRARTAASSCLRRWHGPKHLAFPA